jgi:endoglycosylceramidase
MKANAVITATILLITVSIFLSPGCNPSADSNQKEGFISIDGQRFVDATGGEVGFHGLNLVNKNPEENYLGPADQDAIKQISSWGFNCIRLGVIWDGLEPKPGQYDEKYLQGIDERIKWAAENNIYVVLDMHQDLYSVLYSDGAPEWATITEDKPHVTGEIWSQSYFISPAVQTAFDNFWKNASAPDGMGIQDHFINAWKHVAERYADQTHVIGYDLMNEPLMGSGAAQIMPSILNVDIRRGA